jgi:hypothetical protein
MSQLDLSQQLGEDVGNHVDSQYLLYLYYSSIDQLAEVLKAYFNMLRVGIELGFLAYHNGTGVIVEYQRHINFYRQRGH